MKCGAGRHFFTVGVSVMHNSGRGTGLTCTCGKLAVQVMPVAHEMCYLFQIRRSDGQEIDAVEPFEAVGQQVEPRAPDRTGFQGGLLIDLDAEPRG